MTNELARRSFRWHIGLLILLVGAAVQQAFWYGLAPDRTMQVFSFVTIAPLALLMLLVWWLAGSGLAWGARLIGFGVFMLVGAAAVAAFRVEGFTGEMIPIFGLRWKPTPRERAKQLQVAVPERVGRNEAMRPENSSAPNPDEWSEFRGPLRDGVVRGVKLRTDWNEQPPRLVWRHPVGAGWSSFAVSGRLLLTQEQRGNSECVVCYRMETGVEVWSHSDTAHFNEHPAGEGPRATPTIHDGLVYTMGAMGRLNCLRLDTGWRVWSRDTLEENGAKNPEWGTAASPLVFGNVVVVNPGGPDGKAVVAYHRLSGKKVWSAGDDPAAYASPQLAELDGVRQVLIFDGAGLAGHDAESGEELWKFPWTNSPKINAAQPIVLNGERIFLSSGYSKGSALISVNRTGDKWSCKELWSTNELKLKFNNAVVHGDYVYGLDEGILVCLSLEDGRRQWKEGRYGYGQILLVDDVLVIQVETTGEVVLVNATPKEHRELGLLAALNGLTWNPPIVSQGKLFVRNNTEAACYDLLLDTNFP